MQIKTWMIIDDDPDEQQLFKDALREVDTFIWCYCSQDFEGAMNILHGLKNKPELIFLDINMPGFSGIQCLEAIKKVDELKDIPVIAYTHLVAQKVIDECKRLGAAYFLVKPNGFTRLQEELRKFTSESWREENFFKT